MNRFYKQPVKIGTRLIFFGELFEKDNKIIYMGLQRIGWQVKNASEFYNIILLIRTKRVFLGVLFSMSLLFTTERNFKSCKMIG